MSNQPHDDYQQDQLIAMQIQQQQQEDDIMGEEGINIGPRPSPGRMCSVRLRTTYGIIRIVQIILSFLLVGIVCYLLSNCVTPSYYVALTVFPIGTIVDTFLHFFYYQYKTWRSRGGNDMAWACMYIAHAVAVMLLHWKLWTDYTKLETACFLFRPTSHGLYSAAGAASMGIVLSVTYWLMGCSACCCHCLDNKKPSSSSSSSGRHGIIVE